MNKKLNNYFKRLCDEAQPVRHGMEDYLYDVSVKHNANIWQGSDATLTSVRMSIGHYVCAIIEKKPQ